MGSILATDAGLAANWANQRGLPSLFYGLSSGDPADPFAPTSMVTQFERQLGLAKNMLSGQTLRTEEKAVDEFGRSLRGSGNSRLGNSPKFKTSRFEDLTPEQQAALPIIVDETAAAGTMGSKTRGIGSFPNEPPLTAPPTIGGKPAVGSGASTGYAPKVSNADKGLPKNPDGPIPNSETGSAVHVPKNIPEPPLAPKYTLGQQTRNSLRVQLRQPIRLSSIRS